MRAELCDVLVVEDDPDFRDAVSLALEAVGLAVSLAGDGAIALAMLRAGLAPQAVLMDMEMPAMDGHATIEAIRGDPSFRQPAIIVMTGRVREMPPMQVNAVLRKPFPMDALLGALGPLVQGQRFVPPT